MDGRMPKSHKNLAYDLDRLNGQMSGGRDSCGGRYNEHIALDWAKQYHNQGDRKSAGRCERAALDYRNGKK